MDKTLGFRLLCHISKQIILISIMHILLNSKQTLTLSKQLYIITAFSLGQIYEWGGCKGQWNVICMPSPTSPNSELIAQGFRLCFLTKTCFKGLLQNLLVDLDKLWVRLVHSGDEKQQSFLEPSPDWQSREDTPQKWSGLKWNLSVDDEVQNFCCLCWEIRNSLLWNISMALACAALLFAIPFASADSSG